MSEGCENHVQRLVGACGRQDYLPCTWMPGQAYACATAAKPCLLAASGWLVTLCQGSTFWLSEAHIYRGPDTNPLLEVEGASMCFVIRDAETMPGNASLGAGARVIMHPCSESAPSGQDDRQPSGNLGWWQSKGVDNSEAGRLQASLSPVQEITLLRYLSSECRAILADKPTSQAEDEALLTRLRAQRDADISSTMLQNQDDVPQKMVVCTDRRPSQPLARQSAASAWLQRENLQLAVQWRLQRKRLLSKVADDLLVQAVLIESGL